MRGERETVTVNKKIVYQILDIQLSKSETPYQVSTLQTVNCVWHSNGTGSGGTQYKCDCGTVVVNYRNGSDHRTPHTRLIGSPAKAATRTYKLKYKENEISITLTEATMNTGDFPEYNGTNNSLFGNGDIADINIKDDVVTIKRLRNDEIIHTYKGGE